jgi:hypothetical protein
VSALAKRTPSLFVDVNGEWRVPEKSELDPNVSSNFLVALFQTFPVWTTVNAIAFVLIAIFMLELIFNPPYYWAGRCRFRSCG